LTFPNIEVRHSYNSEWDCSDTNEFGCIHYDLVVECDLTFVNSGNADGQKCVNVLIYVDDYLVQQKVACETVRAGGREESRVKYVDENHAPVPYTYRCELR
jgi:hypothetical protein